MEVTKWRFVHKYCLASLRPILKLKIYIQTANGDHSTSKWKLYRMKHVDCSSEVQLLLWKWTFSLSSLCHTIICITTSSYQILAETHENLQPKWQQAACFGEPPPTSWEISIFPSATTANNLENSSTMCFTHLSLKLRNQNPLSGVYSIFPFLLTEYLTTPRSQSVFPVTSTFSNQTNHIPSLK